MKYNQAAKSGEKTKKHRDCFDTTNSKLFTNKCPYTITIRNYLAVGEVFFLIPVKYAWENQNIELNSNITRFFND